MEIASDRSWLAPPRIIRHGGCVFIPEPFLEIDPADVLPNEPLTRIPDGKTHRAECVWREGGETIYVSRRHPSGLSLAQFTQLYGRRSPERCGFVAAKRAETVFVRGRVSHPDHGTVTLRGWHRVANSVDPGLDDGWRLALGN